MGVPVWLGAEYLCGHEGEELWRVVPPQLYGLAASFIGMLLGSSMPNWIKHRQADPAELANRQAVATGH